MLRDCVLGCSRVIIKVVTISIVAVSSSVVTRSVGLQDAEIEPPTARERKRLNPQQYVEIT